MQALEFWKAVTVDRANLLEQVIALMAEHKVRYCVIGGQAVNAYVEPLVSPDLDLVVAVEQIPMLESVLRRSFDVGSFPHSLKVSLPGSDLRVQIQTDSRYASFLDRAQARDVLGVTLPVADVEDVLRGKNLGRDGRDATSQQADERPYRYCPTSGIPPGSRRPHSRFDR